MKTLVDREDLAFGSPGLGCVLSLPGLPGGGSKLYDRSPYGNHGSITGATWVRLPSGLWCLSFDGVDDYINCGNGKSFDVEYGSILVWVNSNDLSDSNTIFHKPGTLLREIYIQAAGFRWMLTVQTGTIDWSLSTAVAVDTWYFVAFTWDGTTARIFKNGAEIGTNTNQSGAALTNTNILYIGYRHLYSDRPFSGYVALPRICNKVFSGLEIANCFNREKHLFGVW